MSIKSISIVAATDDQGLIGRDGGLPWDHISADMSRFRRLTVGKTILMGRKTHQSIGRTLPDRNNIVLTSHIGYVANGCFVVYDFNTGLLLSKVFGDEVVVIGGRRVYEQALAIKHIPVRLFLTKVNTIAEGDTYFPRIDWREFTVVKNDLYPKGEKTKYDLEFIEAYRESVI